MSEQFGNVQNAAKTASPTTKSSGQPWVSNVVDLDPILEAEAKYGPVFRRELFDVAYAAYQSIKDNGTEDRVGVGNERESANKRTSITLLDIYGQKHKVTVFAGVGYINGQPHLSKPIWMYNCIQHLGGYYGWTHESALLPYVFARANKETDMTPCFEEKELTEKAAVWIQEWQRSELRSRLSVFLQEHAKKTLERVDKIMCFGLGCFPTQWERSRQRSYTQHLAACTVRDLIAQQQGGAAPQIFAQDPSYCAAGMSYIQSHFNMSILDDPEGFKALDGHTFVLSFAPNVPVRQITLGLTHESNGPAGLFCDRIRSEGLECNGKRCEDGRVCPYTTCEPSPAVWKYKQESYWIEYRDRDEQNYFGEVGVYLKKRA